MSVREFTYSAYSSTSLFFFQNSIEVRESDPSSRVDREAKKKIRRTLKSCESKKKQKKTQQEVIEGQRCGKGAQRWKRMVEGGEKRKSGEKDGAASFCLLIRVLSGL